ncbi:hypothetical protein GCM10010329_27410 [Streptomyces spiroverticillatus]|uniref:Polysaccharide lyase-like protein n=1 Tax=Streptomyces finlayi TaxID=67296 RepID=A0A918WW70_9ACTN|nr:heparin lyase I family protein [Streptomyces finlayi]GHA03558.1 hypothetical protein GCM10010329_27410 [Streptomyces spiroverticillatus]GHC87720.1 hypothetical protein GCM10010334_19820 [Streptomyces finlayi]
MRKPLVTLSCTLGLTGSLLATGCAAQTVDASSPPQASSIRPTEPTVHSDATRAPVSPTPTRPARTRPAPPPATKSAAHRPHKALLDVTYESGTPDSGIPGLAATNATAPDAAGVISPGSGSRRGIMHKVTLGDDGYVSNGAPRSESATDRVPAGRFQVGDERRYEFSVLLKDWQAYKEGDPVSGDILFQAKPANSNPPSFFLSAQRNAILFRNPGLDRQTPVVADYRPYIGRWMRFRIDVRWADDDTGYYKVSALLPGQKAFQLKKVYTRTTTWLPVNPSEHGYLKWGLYRPDSSLERGCVKTRIVHHDNIRVTELP